MARDIGGLWKIIQTAGGDSFVSVTHVAQPDGAFTVQAQQIGPGVQGFGGGHVSGDFVSFIINWDNQTAGAYNGSFDGNGVINGSTFDLRHPESVAGWHSDRAF